MGEQKTGIELIAQERLEQKTKHNHSPKSDYEQYPDYELVILAQAILDANPDHAPDTFDAKFIKKVMEKSYVDRLIIAGALIAAEIDRTNFENENE